MCSSHLARGPTSPRGAGFPCALAQASHRLAFVTALRDKAKRQGASRVNAVKARTALQKERAEAAAAMREQRHSLAEARQLQLTEHSLQVKETVNACVSERFVHPEASRRMLQHPHYSEVTAVVADVTSSVRALHARATLYLRRLACSSAATTAARSGPRGVHVVCPRERVCATMGGRC